MPVADMLQTRLKNPMLFWKRPIGNEKYRDAGPSIVILRIRDELEFWLRLRRSGLIRGG
jgi:hypothetical protein